MTGSQKVGVLCLGLLAGLGLGNMAGCATDAAYSVPRYSIERPPANPTRADLVRMGVPVRRWFALGRCEQPGDGVGGVEWTNAGPSFVAGLGFAASTWRAYKPAAYPDPPDASPWQIIVVGERVRADVGITAWGAWRCF